MINYGNKIRQVLAKDEILPLIGVYDVYSATLSARYFDGLFISGFSFAASYYGMPDIGFIAWSDILSFVQRTRLILPKQHIIVDIDDGYCDPDVACHVAVGLERIGASGVVLEDQQRPRMCGHLDGKQIMELDAYLAKLKQVLNARTDLFVVARTDATDEAEVRKRALAFAAAGADAILVEAVKNLDFLKSLRREVRKPLVFNQIAGGKSPPVSLSQLKQSGVSLVNYSTPCLFAAHDAIHAAMQRLRNADGLLKVPDHDEVDVKRCNNFLHENIELRKGVALDEFADVRYAKSG